MNQPLSMDQVFLNKVIAIIEANLENEKFGAGELSHELGMSRSNINRKLRSLQKNSISQLIQEFRLQRAMEMLQQKVATVAEVAYRVGFSSPAYFNKCFHEYYGFPPGEVKKLEEYDREKTKSIISPELTDGSSEPQNKKQTNRKKLIIWFILSALLIISVLFSLYYFFNVALFQRSTSADYITITDAEKSIAILPFRNLSNDPEQDYFSEGMVDAILDHLFKVGELKVISSTSTMRYKKTQLPLKKIAQELDVSTILEGSIQKMGSKVRVTVQLLDANTANILWSNIYDRNLDDIFSIQSEIAQNIARELKVKLTSEETMLISSEPLTQSQISYDYYLRGNDLYSRSYANKALRQAIDMYTKAIQEDSSFSNAYSRRARVFLYCWWSYREGWQTYLIKAQSDIKKGLALNPQSIDLELTRAIYYYMVNRDYDHALRIIEELKMKMPRMASLYLWSAYILRRKGKLEESIHEHKIAIRLDPFNVNACDEIIATYELMHEYNLMIDYARQGLSILPEHDMIVLARDVFNYNLFYAYLYNTADLNQARKESGLKEENILFEVYYYSRKYDELINIMLRDTTKLEDQQFQYQCKNYDLALIHYLNGKPLICKIYADSAISDLKEKVKEFPDDERYYATLGKCLALIGQNKEAITFGNKAVELKPVKLDAWQGAVKEQDLMEIYIFTGNYDLALDKMKYLLSIPSTLHVGSILLDPIYDDLRNLPRFHKIIKSAQKQLKKEHKV